MPGTIHISVLGFKDLPSSSISLKVSMGKRVYQTGDNEDFSFPLTTLRDNMIITLHDTEGHEVFNTGVQTMSVVQKGFWDEFLPLQGGGHVQLKLTFVLSEEERNRIRKMRESAMKKKHKERFSSSLRHLESAGAASSLATSSSRATQEVSDSSTSTTTDPEGANSQAIHAGKFLNSEGVSKEGPANNQKQIVPFDADGSQQISSAASLRTNKHVNYDKALVKIDAKLDLDVSPQRPISQETSSSMTKSSVASQQYLLEGTPSNTDADGSREISSADSSSNRMDKRINYDKSLVKIDAKLDLVSPQRPILQLTSSSMMKSSTASQQELHKQDIDKGTPSNNDTDGSKEISSAASVPKIPQERVDDTNLSKPAEKIGAKSHLVDVPKRPKFFQAIQDQKELFNQPDKKETLRRTPSNDTRRVKPPPVEVQSHGEPLEGKTIIDNPKPAKLKFGKLNNPFLTGQFKRIQTNETEREELVSKTSPESGELKDLISAELEVQESESFAKPWEDMAKLSVVEATNSPQTVHKEQEILNQQSNLSADGSAIQLRNSYKIIVLEPVERLETEDSRGNGHISLESSGAWIFPDHTRRLCVTTGSKHAIDLVEPCEIEEKNHKKEESFSLREKMEKRVSFRSESCTEMEKADMTSDKIQKLRPESSAESEKPVGQIGQVIKVAIMVAFGALVLLTRQGKPR